MAIGTPTLKTSLGSGDNVDRTTYTVQSITFLAGRVYVLDLEYSNGIGANTPPPSSIVTSTATVVWSKAKDLPYKTTSTNRMGCAIYVGVCTASGVGTTAINFAATATGCMWVMSEYTGVDTTTPWKVANVAFNSGVVANGGGSLTATLGALTTAGSRTHACSGANIASAAPTADADWTTLDNARQGTPAENIIAAYSTAELAYTVANNTATNNIDMGVIVIELLPAPATLAVGQATETDSGLTVTASKALAVGQAESSGSALSVTASKSLAVGQAEETDSAFALATTKDTSVGQAEEASTALAVTAAKTLAVGQAVESDSALAATSSGGGVVGQASETDEALPVTATKTLAVGIAEELDTALPVSSTVETPGMRVRLDGVDRTVIKLRMDGVDRTLVGLRMDGADRVSA